MKTITKNRLNVFPMAPRDELFSLELGNGTRFTVLVNVGPCGMFIAIEGHGAYTFCTKVSSGYVAEKLRILEGDAERMANFINDQNK